MISVLNTGVANIASVINAMNRLGVSAKPTADPDELIRSSLVVLPGVGTAKALMSKIQSLELQACLRDLTQPVLGICLGMQVLYRYSEEGNVPCLGLFPGEVKRLQLSAQSGAILPLPHMGWNQVRPIDASLLLRGVPEHSDFYFVHSFRVPTGSETKGVTVYGEEIPAVIEERNWFGTQFHPERSGKVGEQVLRNFIKL